MCTACTTKIKKIWAVKIVSVALAVSIRWKKCSLPRFNFLSFCHPNEITEEKKKRSEKTFLLRLSCWFNIMGFHMQTEIFPVVFESCLRLSLWEWLRDWHLVDYLWICSKENPFLHTSLTHRTRKLFQLLRESET